MLSYCDFCQEYFHPHFSFIKDTEAIKLSLCLNKHSVMKTYSY